MTNKFSWKGLFGAMAIGAAIEGGVAALTLLMEKRKTKEKEAELDAVKEADENLQSMKEEETIEAMEKIKKQVEREKELAHEEDEKIRRRLRRINECVDKYNT